jgi:glycosyltransferase involved in cell wall biosynthesis
MENKSYKYEFSVVMPCLNEVETVGICVEKSFRFFELEGISAEVVVADNGSTDGSQELAANAGARVVSIPDRGYGSALRGGIEAAQGKFIIIGDSDDSYDFSDLMPFVEKLREGYDLVMGNRFKGCIATNAMPPLHRYLGNPVLTKIGQLLFQSPCGDFHCGLRGFTKDAFLKMGLQTTGMEFASEIVVKASLLKMRITEVPTNLSPDGRTRLPHLRSWRDGWRHLRFLLLFSPRWLFFMPGLVLFLFGGFFGALLTWTPLKIGSVVFDTSTLLVSSMSVLIGSQLMIFGMWARAFAAHVQLLPENERIDKFLRIVNLEIGIGIGIFFFLTGLGLLLYSVFYWGQHGFGPLNYAESQRLVIPSVTFVMLGIQTIFSSFFFGILRLKLQ